MSPPYEALIVAVPVLVELNVTEHVAVPAVVPAANVQVVKVPVTPVTVNVTEPVGVLTGATEVSVTVAVHVEPWLTNTGLVHVTAVVVVLLLTTTVAAVVVLLVA